MRIYKRQMIADTHLTCCECGDVIEPGDYYYLETVKYNITFWPSEKYVLCVGCHCLEHEVAALEVSA